MKKRALLWPLYGIGFFFVLMAGALLFLQTSQGKRLLADQLSSHLSTPEAGFELSGLEGSIPLDMRVTRLRLSDRDGVWLKVDGITFDWSPKALLRGRIQVDEIAAQQIEVLRLPIADATPEPTSDEPFRLPELPTSLLPITVERFALPEISLAAPVFGEAASFDFEGSIRANDLGDTVTAKLSLERTDEKTAFMALDAVAGLNPPILDLALNAGEQGGMIAALIGRPDIGDVNLRLEGKGPLDHWQGRLAADADGLSEVEANLSLALVEQPRLAIDGTIKPSAGSLPEDLALLIGETLSISLDVVQTKAQALDIRKAFIQVDLATLNTEGAIDFDDGALTLQSDISAPDLAPLSSLANASLSGAAKATLDVAGTLSAPKGKVDIQINAPALDDKSARTVATTVNWTSISPLSSDQPSFNIVIDGQADDLTLPGIVLPDRDIGWNARLVIPLEGEIDIKHIEIETAGSSLSGKGKIDPATIDGAIDLALNAPALKRVAAPYGQQIDGNAEIKAAVQFANRAQTIDVDLDANLTDLSGLPPGAAELIGEQASLKATATLDPSRTLTLETLAIDGTHIQLDGKASLGLDQQDIGGQLNLNLPDLAVLGSLLPDGTEGALSLDADFGGSLDVPGADINVNGRDLMLAGEAIKTLAIRASGQDLIAAPNGDLRIDLTARQTPAVLKLDYQLAAGKLTLDAISLTAPETEIGGDLVLDLEKTTIDGAIKGRVGALSALEPWLQQEIGGSADIQVSLVPDGERQNADLTIQGRNISGNFGKLGLIDASARITDAINQPEIDAKGTATGFEQGTTKIDALILTASGSDGALDLEFSAAGEVIETLELTGKGAARFEDGFSLGIEQLEGSFAGEPLQLSSPLAFQQTGDDIWLSDLELELGKARLRGDIEIGRTSTLGEITLKALPLSWIEVFGGPALDGDARANINLSGSPSNPKVIASLDIEGVLGESVTPADVPLDVSLNAELDQGQLATSLEVSRLSRKPITAEASLPLHLTLSPFAFNMPEEGELDGRIDAEVLLSRLADFLAIDDQELNGTLLADIAIGGTIGAPEIVGPVTLKGGRYENGSTGTVIRDLNLIAKASTERIEVSEFNGKTGKNRGTLKSSAWLQLDADQNFPLSFSLSLDEARLVNRDDADARISGDLTMTGNLKDAQIEGELTVNRAEISLPEGGGPNLPDIDVMEVGGQFVNLPEEEAEGKVEEKPFDPVLNLRVKLPNKVYVRGRGLDSEWQGDLGITGLASDPIIVGSLEVKKGYFDFLDRRFQLERGEISFSGATPPNPIIALEAVAEDGDFAAIIKLNGPADDPQFLLESEPALPQDEVLARLLFNRELSEIGAVEAGKLAIAVNKLRSGGGGFDVFGELRNILKIDTLDVVSDEEGESRVKAGKYLNDEVYVEVEQGATEESGRARVEIELLPNLSFEADTSENANSGVGLKWKFNY